MLAPNTILQNRYSIVCSIGKGGMGTVYQATDRRLRNTVALKEMFFSHDEKLRKAFEREASLLAELRHPALPKVIDHFSEGGGQFLVMEFIPGEDLGEMLARRGGAFPIDEVLGWGDQLLDALDYIHTQEPPVIHRDVKPQNLKLTKRGQLVLLDFGLAKGSLSQMTKLTTGSSIVGFTPAYGSLEQIQGAGTDARSDLYAVAATMYHLITGEPPSDALSRATTIVSGQPDPLRPPSEINPQVPSAIATILQRSMALNREQRPATAAEMRQELYEARQTIINDNSKRHKDVLPSTILAPGASCSEQSPLETSPAINPASLPIANQRAAATAEIKPSGQGEESPQIPLTPAALHATPKQRSGRSWNFGSSILLLIAVGIALALAMYHENQSRRALEVSSNSPAPASTSTPYPHAPAPTSTPYPHVIRGENGNLRPARGYQWVNPDDPADLRVKLKPGLISEDGKLSPASGYRWVNPNDPDDVQVELIPGLVKSEDGKLSPASGYRWVNPNDPADLRVERIQAQP